MGMSDFNLNFVVLFQS